MTDSDDDDFDDLARRIQAALYERERAIYSQEVLGEYHDPKNVGRMPDPDGSGVILGSCGDTMEIYLKVMESRIDDATFMTDGCGATIACGSRLTGMVKGKSLTEVVRITDEDLIRSLGGLPEENLHCAKLAVDTLHKAIQDHLGGR